MFERPVDLRMVESHSASTRVVERVEAVARASTRVAFSGFKRVYCALAALFFAIWSFGFLMTTLSGFADRPVALAIGLSIAGLFAWCAFWFGCKAVLPN